MSGVKLVEISLIKNGKNVPNIRTPKKYPNPSHFFILLIYYILWDFFKFTGTIKCLNFDLETKT